MLGAKNHTAAGLYCVMRGRTGGRVQPQFMKPMPRGRVPIFVGCGLSFRRVCAVWRWDERREGSVPAARKPMPPVWGVSRRFEMGKWGV